MSDRSTPALSQKELDHYTCRESGCTTNHGPLVFTCCTHKQSAVAVEYSFAGVAALYCKQCSGHVINIALSVAEQARLDPKLTREPPPPGKTPVLSVKAPCHFKRGVYAVYNNGNLELVCARCKKPVTTLEVARTSVVAAKEIAP